MMNVIRAQVSEKLRHVLNAPPPPPGAMLSSSSLGIAAPPPPPPLIPANRGQPQTGNLNISAADEKVKCGAKEFVRFDEDKFPDSTSSNNVSMAACGGVQRTRTG